MAVGIKAAAIKIAGVTNQVCLKIGLTLKTLIATIAIIVTAAVSISKDIFARFDMISNSGADPVVGSGLAALNCLDE